MKFIDFQSLTDVQLAASLWLPSQLPAARGDPCTWFQAPADGPPEPLGEYRFESGQTEVSSA
jgi:hypothetical protein